MLDNSIKIMIRSLFKYFDDNVVLNGIDLDIEEGSSLVILGGSGAGKSILIKTIVGLIAPDSGSVVVDGLEITKLDRLSRFRFIKNIGFLFQGGALFDSLTIQDNITFFAAQLADLSSNDLYELAKYKLDSVGLSSKILKLYPSDLSGGMQKRVALARAICTNPSILFLDEPTTGLDPIMANVINDLILKLQLELNATTVTITHDMNSASIIAREIALMFKGKISWYGSIKDLRTADHPYLKQFIHGSSIGLIEV